MPSPILYADMVVPATRKVTFVFEQGVSKLFEMCNGCAITPGYASQLIVKFRGNNNQESSF